jgi:hypothetical protein
MELFEIAQRVLRGYAGLSGVACAAVTGSVAEGCADAHSDIDMTVYYDALPPADAIAGVRTRLGVAELLWSMGDYGEEGFIESYLVDGVECQVGQTTVTQWESEIESVRGGTDPGSPLHKAMSGTLLSVAIAGHERLDQWKARIRDYPHELRVAMVRHHLAPPRPWRLVDRLEARDGRLWWRQMLVEASYNLIGVSAGLSRRYFTPFQFKRASAFLNTLDIAPVDFARRLEEMWSVDARSAAASLRQLSMEMVELVERELPEVDTSAARRAADRGQ